MNPGGKTNPVAQVETNENTPTRGEAELAHDMKQTRTAKFVRIELDLSLDHPMDAEELRIFGDVLAQHVQASVKSAKAVRWTKLTVNNADFRWNG